MPPKKSLAHAAYVLGILLVVLPLADITMSIWPLRLSDDRWRFGAVGTLSSALLVPLIGLLLIMAVAVWLDQRRVQRVIGSICIVLAVLVAVLDVLFILDYFQARMTITPRAQHVVAIATATAFIKHLLTIGVLILLGRAGFAGPKPILSRKPLPNRSPDPLLTRPAPTSVVE